MNRKIMGHRFQVTLPKDIVESVQKDTAGKTTVSSHLRSIIVQHYESPIPQPVAHRGPRRMMNGAVYQVMLPPKYAERVKGDAGGTGRWSDHCRGIIENHYRGAGNENSQND